MTPGGANHIPRLNQLSRKSFEQQAPRGYISQARSMRHSPAKKKHNTKSLREQGNNRGKDFRTN